MHRVRVVTRIDECRDIWQQVIPDEYITDLWEVRACFQQYYKRRPVFIVAEDQGGICGLMPLSWIDESRNYGYFPGETWNGKTWLEQNRIYASNRSVMHDLIRHCPPRFSLRYLSASVSTPAITAAVDEIGYVFLPEYYNYDMENYFREFSHKSIKQILREVSNIENMGTTYRYDKIADFGLLLEMNIKRFGSESYFYDNRFRESFKSLISFLAEKDWLRFTTLLINDEPAAVDMGCLYRGVYTLMAGATSSKYPGVAKVINLHHMKRACQERMQQVDFMCGDFTWKKIFHLSPRPLFLLSNIAAKVSLAGIDKFTRRAANV